MSALNCGAMSPALHLVGVQRPCIHTLVLCIQLPFLYTVSILAPSKARFVTLGELSPHGEHVA